MNNDKLGIIDIKKCIYPGEKLRFWIAILTTIPAILFYIFITFSTMGIALIIIPIIIFFSWFITRLLRASLIGSCIEVSQDNFPQVYNLLEDIRKYLDYPKKVEAYVFQNGDVNSYLIKKFRTRIILLPHELLVDMLEGEGQEELIWILARSIGHLKAKHLSLWGLDAVIEAFEKLFFLNIFLYPYERATQYSGDRIGLVICSNLNAALTAMNKLMVGNILSKKVSLLGELKQSNELKGSFFAWLSECSSTHPHTTKRIVSLIMWTKEYNHKMYTKFIDTNPEIKMFFSDNAQLLNELKGKMYNNMDAEENNNSNELNSDKTEEQCPISKEKNTKHISIDDNCKRCNAKLVEKKVKNSNKKVLVCINYPKCKELIYL